MFSSIPVAVRTPAGATPEAEPLSSDLDHQVPELPFRCFDLADQRGHLHRACAPVTAFLVPGALGVDPPLENLRTRLSDEVRLDLVDMPDIGCLGSVIASIPATAEIVAADIVRRCPSGVLSLVGFSFGGSVALEVATQLSRAGRDIAFLGILDAPFKGSDMRDGYSARFNPVNRARAVVRSMKSAAGTETRRLIAAAAASDQERWGKSHMIRKALIRHLRSKALGAWVPQACQARGLLLWTGEMGGRANLTRWQELCPNLRLVPVPGDHQKLLEGASLEAVATALAAALRQHAGEPSNVTVETP